jgi:hypothetical protein
LGGHAWKIARPCHPKLGLRCVRPSGKSTTRRGVM